MIEPATSTYLKYLPAIYQQPESAATLGPFLLPFEEILSEVEHLLLGVDHYFDPANTPDEFLPWLASWVALELDGKWPLEKQRKLIANAMALYLRRGTVEGLKQAIGIYDEDLQVSVVERAMPGGMQIGVASRIGGFVGEPSKTYGGEMRIQQIKRNEPVDYYDYYVVEPEAQPDQSGVATRIYYRTDSVEWIRKGQTGVEDATRDFVWLKLTTGAVRYHEPATVSRLHKVADTRYSLTVNDAVEECVGDTLLVDHIEQPFRFIVDIGIPTDWLFRFEMDMFASEKPFLEESLVKAIGDLLRDNTIITGSIKEDEPGRKWTVPTKQGEQSVERIGWALHLSGEPGNAPVVMLQVDDVDFHTVDETLRQKIIDLGMPFPFPPESWRKSDSLQWLMIGDVDKLPAYLAERRGSRLFVYEFVGDAKWQGVAGTRGPAENGGQPSSEPSDVSRAIKAIVDDAKPSHMLYTLRFGRKSGPERLPPSPIGERFIARLRKLALPQEDGPVPAELKDELAQNDIWLSDRSRLTREADDLWRINDRDAYPLHVRRVKLGDDETLEVSQRSLIEETMIIG